MLLVRDAQKFDIAALRSLANELNSVNLPSDDREISRIVERSRSSFAGTIRDPLARSYVFVLEDPRSGRILGTSMVIAQHGTRESPCAFFLVSEREHYSSTLDRHFRHRVLSIGYHFDGPTEIGGLVVLPRHRGGEQRPGKQLAYVRFLYAAMHRDRFRERMLAELMPPLLEDGRSLFWESCGKRFTGLEYQEADKKSRENKEFIQQLVPPGDLYATLFPPRVQKVLGAVGPQAMPVKHLLERVGFQFAGRIDPFDGGPHYEARIDDISVVRAYRRARLSPKELARGAEYPEVLVAVERSNGAVRFRAVRTRAVVQHETILLPRDARVLLQAESNDWVHLIPFV